MFVKFVNEGKCTIGLKVPEVDLQIKAESIQLKGFLNFMKEGLSGKKSDVSKDNKFLRVFGATTSVTTTQNFIAPPITKMIIKSRGDYPCKGFPRTLKILHINGIKWCQLQKQILYLSNLCTLDISDNLIEKLPKDLGNLKHLSEINVSKNKLGISGNPKDWEWMNGQNIQRSLVALDISFNELKFMPLNITKFENLVTLKIGNNDIVRIPFAIKQLIRLRDLKINNNKIQSLPCTMTILRLNSIDLSDNDFRPTSNLHLPIEDLLEGHTSLKDVIFEKKPSTLLELAARNVIKSKLSYLQLMIPQIIKDILLLSPNCVNCDKLCIHSPIYNKILAIKIDTKQILSNFRGSKIIADGPVCGNSCVLQLKLKYFWDNVLR
ncbi:unnamed protein product [Diamesa serratosioi]